MSIATNVALNYNVFRKVSVEIRHLSRVIVCMTTYQTRQVLGGAYRGRDVGSRPLLTHLVLRESVWNVGNQVHQDQDVKSGCRQPVDNLADEYSDPEGNDKRPTCPTCARKWDKLQGTK